MQELEKRFPGVPSIGCIGMSYQTKVVERGVGIIAFSDGVAAAANLLEHEDLRRVANQLFRVINSREAVMELVDRGSEGIRVLVGKENPNSAFAGSSVIISKYRIGQDNTGAMGLIGPIRMDYARLIPHLEYFSQTLGRLLGETLEEQK